MGHDVTSKPIGSAGRGVVATETATRVTPTDGPTFREVMRTSGAALLRGAESAVRSLPMSPMVAASVRPNTTQSTTGAGRGMQQAAEGVGGTAAGTGASTAQPSVEGALAQSQEMNLYFIELQERIAAENRAFTTYSNVLKARHETVKNAIGNIR